MTRIASLLAAAFLGTTLLAARAPAREVTGAPTEEDRREPTPLESPEEVARLMKKQGLKEGKVSAKERGVKEVTLAGAITLGKKNQLGFMPLMIHHMAVEHWFVTGIKVENIKDKLGAGRRCFVKLRGKCELKKLYSPGGGGGLSWYGNGLSHGQVWGGIMDGEVWAVDGYHERVYELKVEKLIWVKSPAEFSKLGVKFATVGYRVGQHIKKKEYAAALELLEQCDALAGDVGAFHWDSAAMRVFLGDMLALRKAPEKWTGADLVKVADALCRAGSSDWPWDRQKLGRTEVETAIEGWSKETRLRVAPLAVKAWKRLAYRHQKDVVLKLLKSLGGAEAERLQRDIAAAEAELKRLKAEFKKRAAAHDYDGMRKTLEELAPHQKLVLDYELAENRLRIVRHHLERCLDLQAQWPMEKQRLRAVKAAVSDLLAEPDYTSTPNSTRKPRFPEELTTHFFPRLTEAEKRAVEKLLVTLGEKLDARKDYAQALVLAELLTGVAGKEARAFLPKLVDRRRKAGAPEWQLKYFEKFLLTVREK